MSYSCCRSVAPWLSLQDKILFLGFSVFSILYRNQNSVGQGKARTAGLDCAELRGDPVDGIDAWGQPWPSSSWLVAVAAVPVAKS